MNNSRDVGVCFCFRWDEGRQPKGTRSNVKRCTLFILVFTIKHANDIHRMTTPWSSRIYIIHYTIYNTVIAGKLSGHTYGDREVEGLRQTKKKTNKRNKYFEYVRSWFYFSFSFFILTVFCCAPYLHKVQCVCICINSVRCSVTVPHPCCIVRCTYIA